MDVLIFLNGLLISRLCFVFHDQPLPNRTFYTLAIVQAGLALAVFGFGLWTLLMILLTLLTLIAPERWLPANALNESRLVGLGVLLLAGLALSDRLDMAGWLASAHSMLLDRLWNWGLQVQTLRPAAWALFGFWLVANEVNLLIRILFHRFHLEPRLLSNDPASEADLDRQEYNAGRIIGILERWLMYSVMVASQSIAVIAVIMAAKGFARFRQLEERAFAEYVLIGTLASTLLTLLIAQLIGGPMESVSVRATPIQ
ncbi:hypothetical protein [Saccharospirillum salsuginis]|uniref:Uncharacterized protein n=1 Tax=Saccharospirillum salsuginis TaxID=418750 RepID=A0A918NDR9_9GAMM|nr:hypothetical protein [Saccharospirillum salsuginis]GGX65023.1 hypothetical protein GCM10007392_36110 [Saccharospirillum salsuginis]